MRSRSLMYLVIAVLAGFSLLAGCARRTAPVASAQAPVATDAATSAVAFLGKSFAVAPFTNPGTDYDLLSGYLPTGARPVPEVVPARLDAGLEQALVGAKQTILPFKMVAACTHSASRGDESGRLATIKYWQNVGACAGADYIVVPMVLGWQERVGSEMGATTPASVNLSLYLVDVHTGGVIKHFHYEETQKTLSDNLLDARKFVSRQGRWVTAMEMAQEALNQGVRELGL